MNAMGGLKPSITRHAASNTHWFLLSAYTVKVFQYKTLFIVGRLPASVQVVHA